MSPAQEAALDALQIILLVLAGWCMVAVLAALLAMPSLNAAARADRLSERFHMLALVPPLSPPAEVRAPVLRSAAQSGYAGIVLDRLLHHACGVLAAGRACLLVLDRESASTVLVAAANGLDADVHGRRFARGTGVVDAALRSGAPVAAPRGGDDPIPAAAGAPVAVSGSLRGVLTIGDCGPVTAAHLERLSSVAALAGIALEHRDAHQLQYSDPRAEIAGLVGAIQAADDQTEAHAHQVAALACEVGEELEVGPADTFELGLAARLHDAGKVRVPTEVLSKPGPLSPRESELMRLHPLWGEEIVAHIPGLEAVALLVRHHHERYDGLGYPDGIAGDRIPLASRIVAACDAYSAMVGGRPYRARMSRAASLAELRRGAGTQFDPDAVEAVVRVVDRTPQLVLA